uniref:phage tail tube protein n=1 Tax=Microbacterium rhizophilus TaxID=3138934 RepID=UPI0031E9CEAC
MFISGPVADLDAITLAEVNSGVMLSCYLTVNGAQITDEQTVIVDGRACSTQDLQLEGNETVNVALDYVYNVAEPTEDVARTTLARGVEGVLVEVVQVDPDVEDVFTVDNWYRAVAIRAGKQVPVPVEDNAVDRIHQPAFVRSKLTELKQFAAA